MPPLDSWLKVTIRMSFLLLPLIVILLIGLAASAAFVYQRLRLELTRLSHETKELRAQLAQRVEQETPQDPSREVYRRFLYYASHEVLTNPLQTIQTSLER